MGQVRHGSATTTHAVRAAVQRSQASIAQSSQTCGVNPRTMSKWRKRDGVDDLETGPKEHRSSVLSQTEEALIIAFRRHASLPLDDRLHALQPTIPHLTRSSLHRCLQRHGISRLPDVEGNRPERRKFNRHPIGHVHVDIAEGRTERREVAPSRGDGPYIQVHPCGIAREGREDDGSSGSCAIRLSNCPARSTRFSPTTPSRSPIGAATSGLSNTLSSACVRTAEPNTDRPGSIIPGPMAWTNGQVERMNRTSKEATVKRHHHADHDQLQGHITDFVAACNDARRLKTLKGLTPCEYICKIWTEQPERFKRNPFHQMTGLNT